MIAPAGRTSRLSSRVHSLRAAQTRGHARAPEARFQLPLVSAEAPVIAELRLLDVNALSPLAALNKLYELQQRVRE